MFCVLGKSAGRPWLWVLSWREQNLTKFDAIQTGMIHWEPTCWWLGKLWISFIIYYYLLLLLFIIIIYYYYSERQDPPGAHALVVGFLLSLCLGDLGGCAKVENYKTFNWPKNIICQIFPFPWQCVFWWRIFDFYCSVCLFAFSGALQHTPTVSFILSVYFYTFCVILHKVRYFTLSVELYILYMCNFTAVVLYALRFTLFCREAILSWISAIIKKWNYQGSKRLSVQKWQIRGVKCAWM